MRCERCSGRKQKRRKAQGFAAFYVAQPQSDGVQVPVVLEVGDRVLELLQLAFLAGDEDVDVLRVDVLRHDLAFVQLDRKSVV